MDYDKLFADLIEEIARDEAEKQQSETERKSVILNELKLLQATPEFKMLIQGIQAMGAIPGSKVDILSIDYLSVEDYINPNNKKPIATINHNILGQFGMAINLKEGFIVIGDGYLSGDEVASEFPLGHVPVEKILTDLFKYARLEGLIDLQVAMGKKPVPPAPEPLVKM